MESETAVRARDLRVLVVDDEPDMRVYIRSCLTRLGVVETHVVEAADGAEALAIARRTPPDLVISDVVMRGQDGVALARALAESPETRDVRVLLVTGSTSGFSAASAWAAERPERVLLAKPFNAARIKEAVEALLRSKGPTPPRSQRDDTHKS